MKHIITVFIFLTGLQIANGQTGNIKGRIVTREGKAAEGVTVALKEANKITVSNNDGLFSLNNISVGKHVLLVSFAGLKTEERLLDIRAGQTTKVDVALSESSQRLNEVVVESRRNRNQKTISATKLPITNLDLPQMVGKVSSTLIADQQVTRVGDAIKNISGVSLTQTRLGVNETYTARGYSIGITGGAGSILKNGLVTNIAGIPEAATLESVEVMKGSTTMLYGNVSGGLIVNLVTKKPKFERGGEIKMQVGSFDQYKPVVDLYGPVTKNLAFRMVGTYENDKSFRDVVKTKRSYINPSLLYRFGEHTSLLMQGEYLNAHLTPDFGTGTLDSGRVLPTTIPVSRFINVAWAYNYVKQSSGSFRLDHVFNNDWQFNFAGSVQRTDVDSYGASLPNTVSKTGDWNRGLARAHSIEKDFTTQLNLNGKFSTGRIEHQVLFGIDFTKVLIQADAFKVATVYDKINILDPNVYMPRTDIPDAPLTTSTMAPSNRAGIYVQDFITLTKKLKLLAGIRWSYQHNAAATTSDKVFSPKLALVYQPIKTSSVFASYSNNFTINTGTDIYGQLLKPSIIHQYELGVKNNFFEGRLSANLSVYRIINSNLASQAEFKSDGTLNSDATVKELKGQTTSDGMEIDLSSNFSKNFYFIAGYGYNYMRFTKTSGAKGSNMEGERVVINPRHTANFTTFYTFSKKYLKGLKLGASAFYTGDRLGGYNNTVGQTQAGSRLLPLKGFTTIDVSAGYGFRKLFLLGKLSNIFNTVNYLVHDNYSITPVRPRELTVSVAFRLI